MKVQTILALLLSFCFSVTTVAQTKPAAPPEPQKKAEDTDDDVVRITTNLVQVDAVVTKGGKMVTNLTADDFEIYEDGRKQTITSFAYISNVPSAPAGPAPEKGKAIDVVPVSPVRRDDVRRTVALVVDDLGLSAESVMQVKKQLRKFITEELSPNDLVAVIRTSGELGALQQFTNDKRILSRAVDRVRWNACSRAGVSVLPRLQTISSQFEDAELSCGGTSYFGTMKALRFIIDAMGQLPGRKSMVILSDSLPVESQEIKFESPELNTISNTTRFPGLLQRIAEKAIRASVVIYAVDTQGLQYTGITAADSMPLTRQNMNSSINNVMSTRAALLWRRSEGGQLISRQTGGFQVRNSNSFELDRILEDQNGYYLIGYRPTTETFNRKFHHIKAKVKRSGMTVRTRFGFLGVSEEDVGPTQLLNPKSTNVALMSPFGAQDIDVNLNSFFTHDKAIGSLVRSFVYVDGKGLKFELVNGRHEAKIELHGVIFGDNGTVVEQVSRGVALSLPETEYQQAVQNGMALRVDMPVKRPGAYQVRVATRDMTTAKIGSAGQFVDIPDLNKRLPAVSGIVLGTADRFSGSYVNEVMERAGVRSFAPNSDLHFGFMTYNATSTSNLVMQAKLFRDGKNVYSGSELPINVAKQTDPSRVFVLGTVRLAPDLELGDYYLQVVITDKSAKKAVPVVQWSGFEISK